MIRLTPDHMADLKTVASRACLSVSDCARLMIQGRSIVTRNTSAPDAKTFFTLAAIGAEMKQAERYFKTQNTPLPDPFLSAQRQLTTLIDGLTDHVTENDERPEL